MEQTRITIDRLYNDLGKEIRRLDGDRAALQRSRQIVDRALGDGNPYYGINTGFGALAQKRIGTGDLSRLQTNLLLSHAVGVGPPVPLEISRLMLQLKLCTLGLGYSGVSMSTFDRLLYFIKHDLVPVVPSRGSLGASGDLAPLAHMSLPLIGEGFFWSDGYGNVDSALRGAGNERGRGAGNESGMSAGSGGRTGSGSGSGRGAVSGNMTGFGNSAGSGKWAQVPAAEVLKEHGLEPVALQPKDGLALINGTQLMSAYGAWVLYRSNHLVRMADLIAAMSLEALQGSSVPFDERIHRLRPHPGQLEVAENVRSLLVNSEILESHRHCGKVQDPYCLRCVPQVHGASRDALRYSKQVIQTELNSVNDNPLVLENGDIVSGGNFHGQPLALAMDHAAVALAELGSISERRTYLLLEGHDGLPKLLMQETGINSGFMIPQYTAASLVSENKILAHPASVDSIPTSLGQEDHVSMGSISALKLLQVFENVEVVLAIELLTAAQALDFRKPLKPGRGVLAAHEYLRSVIPHLEEDRFMRSEIDRGIEMLRDPEMITTVEGGCQRLN